MSIGLLALMLRLPETSRPLWMDEIFTVWFSSLSLHYLWTVVPRFEVHPPLHYSAMKLVTVFGTSEFTVRLPSAICGAAAVLVAWRVLAGLPGRATAGLRGAALVGALLAALLPYSILQGQEARPYAALTLAVALLLLAARRWLDAVDAASGGTGPVSVRANAWRFLGLVLAAALTGWLHKIGGLYIAATLLALGAAALVLPSRPGASRLSRLLHVTAVAASILVLLLPTLSALMERVGDWADGAWMGPMTPFRIRAIMQELLVGFMPAPSLSGFAIAAALLVLAAYGAIALHREKRPWVALLLAVSAFAPLVAALVLAVLGVPVFAARTMLPATLAICLLVGVACCCGVRPTLRAPLSIAVIGLFAFGAWSGQANRAVEPWDEAARILGTRVAPEEPVLALPTEAALAVQHYLTRQGAPRRALVALPAPYPATGLPNRSVSGSPALPEFSEDDLRNVLHATRDIPSLWVVERYDGGAMLREALAARRDVLEEYRLARTIRLSRFGTPREDTCGAPGLPPGGGGTDASDTPADSGHCPAGRHVGHPAGPQLPAVGAVMARPRIRGA